MLENKWRKEEKEEEEEERAIVSSARLGSAFSLITVSITTTDIVIVPFPFIAHLPSSSLLCSSHLIFSD